MTRYMSTNRSLSLIVLGTVMGIGGCSSNPSPPGPASAEDIGTVSMALSTVVNGATYALVNVELEIQPTTFCCGTILFSGPPNPDGGTSDLSTSLQTGTYEADLFPGWTLERLDAEGVFEPVNATLTSSSFVDFTIFNGTTSTVSFTFETDGVTVVVGSGTLDVAIDVNQVDAACTPLGTTCGSGSWCPPASLTGEDLACVSAGSVAVGQPCADPTSCVANASCFNLNDAGAVCAALCSSANFNQPCSSGGTCQPVGSDYGICE